MKVVVIGGVAGGASAAARLRRLDESAEILILEKGGYVSYANCGLPYYIGGTIKERAHLFLQTPERFDAHYNIHVRVENEVYGIDAERKVVQVRDLTDGREYEESFDKLILSPGAEAIRPPLPGIDLPHIFTLRSVPDTDKIDNYIKDESPKHATVVGAGFIGLEMAENLRHIGLEVDIVEAAPQVMNPVDLEIAGPVQKHMISHGVRLNLGVGVQGFEEAPVGSGYKLKVLLADGRTLLTDMIILSIGVRADTKLAKAVGLKLGETGAIWVNEFMQTSHPDIYAAGDAVEFPHPLHGKPWVNFLAGPANKQGRIVADNIVGGNHVKYRGSIGTSIAKIFDLTVAATGLNEKTLKRMGIPYQVLLTHNGSHAGYYPGATPISLKTIVSPEGKILGAQAVGMDGVDKRIDIIATLIGMGGTIEDLTEVEHAYAPPFSSAKDPVNIAGFALENWKNQKCQFVSYTEVEEMIRKQADFTLIDARTPQEYTQGHIPTAKNISVWEMRDRLSEIPTDKPVVVYCGVGLRAYHAERLLRQLGYADVRNMTGGWKTWDATH